MSTTLHFYFLIIHCVFFGLGHGQDLSFTFPNKVSLGQTFSIICKKIEAGIAYINIMIKNSSGVCDQNQRLVGGAFNVPRNDKNNRGKAFVRTTDKRVQAAGHINKSVTAIITGATCSDEREYCCSTNWNDRNGLPHDELKTGKITVEVPLEKINLTSEPNESMYLAGTELKLTCEALLGRADDKKVEWLWEYKSRTDNAWKTYWNESSITSGQTELKPCYQKQTSILTHKVTVEDHEREYRCLYNVGTDRYEKLAATFTIKTDKGVGDSSSESNEGTGGSSDESNKGTGGSSDESNKGTGGSSDESNKEKPGGGTKTEKPGGETKTGKPGSAKQPGRTQASKVESSGDDDDDDDTTAATIAIAVVGTVLLVGLAGGVFFMVTRRNRPAAAERSEPAVMNKTDPAPVTQHASEAAGAHDPSVSQQASVADDPLGISQPGDKSETSEDDTISLSDSSYRSTQ